MMMISNRTTSASRARRWKFAVLALFLLALGAVSLWRGALTDAFFTVAGPLLHSRLAGSQESLESRLARADALLADRDALFEENLELKKRLGRDAGVVRILGAVLLRPPATPYDTLVIDIGSAEGVAAGDVVSAGGGAVVGVVSEVYAHASRVTLYSAPGQRYDALLRGVLPLAVEGQGGGSLHAQLPAGSVVAVGDTAVLPGIAASVLARVSAVAREEGESFMDVYFTLPVDVFSLRFVEVWKQQAHVTE